MVNNKLIIQKSTPLYGLWDSDLTLSDFKIMDMYLSKINSHDVESREVIFTKKELEKLLGIKKINVKDLDERLERLMGLVEIPDILMADGTAEKIKINLFEVARIRYNPVTKEVEDIYMICTPTAIKYIFNVENIGYFRYALQSVTRLNSRYAYILFMYLERMSFRKEWSVSVEEIKKIMNCDRTSNYKNFKRFNDKVLKKCTKEINDKTELEFEYTPIRKGRTVTDIEFTIKNNHMEIIDDPKGLPNKPDDNAPMPEKE